MTNKNPGNLSGSVLVAGAGIAGMQCALDLANSGYYVHLLEKSSGIGGIMSELDKTFPTNDCAM
ncbi:MAG: heterodisulfide reductase [Deltaproteobacteria bacterium]|nr:MAG: heterodisulfide reductase [Deltaproteobacteria bacterium]